MRSWLIMILPLIATACVSRPPMDKQLLADKTVRLDVKSGNFTQKTFEDFNADWWASNNQAGQPHVAPDIDQKALTKYDPTPKIASGIKEVLLHDLGMKSTDKSPDYVAKLDTTWGIEHHPLALTRYSIFYRAHLNLEGQQAKVGNQYPMYEWFTCSRKTDSKYSYADVFADDAAAVKEMLKPVADECIAEFTKKIHDEVASGSQPK